MIRALMLSHARTAIIPMWALRKAERRDSTIPLPATTETGAGGSRGACRQHCKQAPESGNYNARTGNAVMIFDLIASGW